MTSIRRRAFFHFLLNFLILGLLAACSGIGGGGASAPADGTGNYGGGALDGPPAGAGNQNQAAGGILSAPADDELLGNCDIWTFLFYGKDFEQQFDSSEDLAWPLSLGSPFSGSFLIRSLSAYPMELQVRVFHVSADGNTVRFKDFSLTNAGSTGVKLQVEIEGVASGDKVEILVPHGQKTAIEGGEEACVYLKAKDFKGDWTASSAEELKKNLGLRIRIAGFTIQVEMPAMPVGNPDVAHPEVDALAP